MDNVTKFVNQQLKLEVNEQKSQVVPVGYLLEHRKAAQAVTAEFRLYVDVVDDFRRKDRALAQDVFIVV